MSDIHGAEYVTEYLRQQLEGPVGGPNEILKGDSPNNRYVLGVLYPQTIDVVADIDEEEPTCPKLTYAKGKLQTEEDLKDSDKNYIILR